MNRHVYKEQRTYLKYDEQHIIGYLNEEVLDNYQPAESQTEGEETQQPWEKAYAYTGSESDGGTIMECSDPSDYGEIANGIIRSKYSESQELAIQRHAINGDYAEGAQEYEEYDAWCKKAVQTAKKWVLG